MLTLRKTVFNPLNLCRNLYPLVGNRKCGTSPDLEPLTSKYQEVTVPVPWGHIAGRWWGRTDQRPILTVHGWQDNCGSFNRLLPLLNLTDNGYLAIDLPGHGLSSRIPTGMVYNFGIYLITLRYIIEHFKWSKTTFLGHSLGGVVCAMYTILYPDDIDFLMCLDGVKPHFRGDKYRNMSHFYAGHIRFERIERSNSAPPTYTMEQIVEKMCEPNDHSIDPKYVHHLIERNTAKSPETANSYYFTRDPRLKVLDVPPMSQTEFLEGAKRLKPPILVVKAREASYYEAIENFYNFMDVVKANSRDGVLESMAGTHHMHLNNPELLAKVLQRFIDKHNNKKDTVQHFEGVKIINNTNA